MGLELYADKLPPELQEGFKADIAKAVIITDRAGAAKLLMDNQFLNAEFNSLLGEKHSKILAKFEADKPGLIEAEIVKRGTKQPWDIRIEELEAREKQKDLAILLKDRLIVAQSELGGVGLAQLSDFAIHEDEEEFKKRLATLKGVTTAWRDAEVKKAREGLLARPNPQTGSSDPQDLKTQYDAAMKAGNGELAFALKEKLVNAR